MPGPSKPCAPEVLDRSAKQLQAAARKHGTELSFSDARARVAKAREAGDRKRENNNR